MRSSRLLPLRFGRRGLLITRASLGVLIVALGGLVLSSFADSNSETAVLKTVVSPEQTANKEQPEATIESVARDSSDVLASGARIYRNPVTGEFTSDPGTVSGRVAQPSMARNRTHAGLYEEVTSYGVKVDFQRRFFNASVATIDGDGKITVRPGAPQNPDVVLSESETTASAPAQTQLEESDS